jgi:hypothetical protein
MPLVEPDFEPDRIVAVLHAHGVRFIIIGGTAAYIHGSPLVTEDIDVVPKADAANLARLSTALTELEAKIRNSHEEPLPFRHDATSLAASVFWHLRTKYGDLDISFTPSGTQGYPDLKRDATSVVLSGTPAELASLADIIRSKEAAGRDKDRRALPILRELLAEQLRARRKP